VSKKLLNKFAKVHVKKDDIVLVISGKAKGKKGKILSVDPTNDRVTVEGINIQKRHRKQKSMKQQSGIINLEGSISASTVMLICDKCGDPTRVGKKILESGDKARVCKRCNEVISIIKSAAK
jgi:large subunit ribosomal protein L24